MPFAHVIPLGSRDELVFLNHPGTCKSILSFVLLEGFEVGRQPVRNFVDVLDRKPGDHNNDWDVIRAKRASLLVHLCGVGRSSALCSKLKTLSSEAELLIYTMH
mmetsp:Transcript_51798/g.77315  ORF Transcript_51798/g.77315 Transcript_51798/m.77315 type:complete len:104 (-) Transcript_51798:1341-1652(-)